MYKNKVNQKKKKKKKKKKERKKEEKKKEKYFRFFKICFLFLSYAAILDFLVFLVNELWLFITINYDL